MKAVEKEEIDEQEPGIEMININLISFNSNHSMIIGRLKTSSKQATMMVPYKVETGRDGNIIAFIIFRKLFPSTTEDTLVATKDTTMLRTYNSTAITQFGRYSVVIENIN